ncbi:GlxA family transcriptional regulator [Sneathiella aquimaris]|uniref:GlxA family transcriptional regulator n=1 Tax=Sneathiella aquimaris TaxID=2599305 RepID=UPI001469B4B0|nr:GlxA family transcriptional regulator [Sneathiella aquimaris]
MQKKQLAQQEVRLSVGFILAKNFTLSAFANFVDVLRLAADDGDGSRPILCRWSILSPTMDTIRCSSGVPVTPTERLGDPSKFDYIAVVGGLIDEVGNLDAEYCRYLKTAAEKGVPIIGICTGSFILHKIGLMDGRRSCVSWFHRADFVDQFDGVEPVSDQIFVVDGDRITCSGGTSAAQLAAFLVERHVGINQARKSLHIMIIDTALGGEKTQPGIPLSIQTPDELVRRALHIMQQEMEVPQTISRIARRLNVGRRKLETHFIKALDMSPAQADKLIRLENARFLLSSTAQPITDIALSTGFCDASHFTRVFKSHFGITPNGFRKSLPVDAVA